MPEMLKLLKFRHLSLFLCKGRWQSTLCDLNRLEKIRNIGIIAHIDAGKTTTTERMLYYSGFTRMIGEVHDGDTVMDYMPQERERGITITSAAITFEWKKHRINLIDTPGHVDFTIEVERSLYALDGGVIILDSSAGVEVQTLTVWNQAKRYEIPCIAYLNKMDKPSADFSMSVNSLQSKLKVKPLLLQIPVGEGRNFSGVIDIVTMRKLIWDAGSDGCQFKGEVLGPDTHEEFISAAKRKEELIENVADLDDMYANKLILAGEESLTEMDLISAIRRITLKRKAVPVMCGSSYKNIAVQPLMDAVVLYLPSPNERSKKILQGRESDLCALVFKIIHDKRRGPLTFLRLYSGQLEAGQKVYNSNRNTSEKVLTLAIPLADSYNEISSLPAGNIAVVSGFKESVTGDTIVSSKSSVVLKAEKGTDTSLEENYSKVLLQVPDPVFFCTVEPPSAGTLKHLEHALHCLEKEDPTFRVEHDEETGQIVIAGMGELHIDIIRERIFREYGIKPYLGPLQVSYREKIIGKATNTHILDKSLGGNKHYAKITVALSPDVESGNFREVKVVITKENDLGKVRADHLKAINNGVRSALNHGAVLGFPVIDVKVNLLWLEVSRGTSLAMLTAATSQCVHQALCSTHMQLLEPVMKLCITANRGYAGSILNNLSQKRSQILSMEVLNDVEVIQSRTPLSELKGYSTTLRALTSGTCSFTIEFDCYEPMNSAEQAKAVEEVTGFAPL